jgi:hypothetical protein
LEKKPEDRYANAAALATDLGLWLAGESILAQPPSAATRLARFLGRHATAAAAVGLLTAFLLTVPFLTGADSVGRQEKHLQQVRQANLDEVRQTLHRGEAAPLLGNRPREAFTRRVNNPDFSSLAGGDPTLELKSFRVGAVDLLPERPVERYRFGADVYISVVTTNAAYGSGIYVAAVEWPGTNGTPEQWFVSLGIPDGDTVPAVICELHRYFGPADAVDIQCRRTFVRRPLSRGEQSIKDPQRLEFDVTPEGIVPRYRGNPIANISRADLEAALEALAKTEPTSPTWPSAVKMLGGAVGLWSRNVDAMFTKATAEPLP